MNEFPYLNLKVYSVRVIFSGRWCWWQEVWMWFYCCWYFLGVLYKLQLIQCVIFVTTVQANYGPFSAFSYFFVCTSRSCKDVCSLSEVSRFQVFFRDWFLPTEKHPAKLCHNHWWLSHTSEPRAHCTLNGFFHSTHFSKNKEVTMVTISVV